MMRIGFLLAIALATTAALPVGANAATIKVSSGALVYSDGSGTAIDEPEESDVTIELDADASKYVVTDSLANSAAGLEPGPGCSRGPSDDIALCGPVAGINKIKLTLGEGDDTATIDGLDLPGEMIGGEGDDWLTGGNQADSLLGSAGDDYIDAGPGNDGAAGTVTTVDGGAGEDTIDGGTGDDTLHGGDENEAEDEGDWMIGDDGNDRIFAEGGDDSAQGGDGDDLVDGSSGEDTLAGDAGNDQLAGGGDDDQLDPGYGDDKLDGQGGLDIASYSERPTTESLHLDVAARRGPGNGTSENDTFTSIEGAIGGQGNDVIDGSSAADALFGGGGTDILTGGSGDDVIDGGDGNGDVLVGGSGSDVMSGGAGADDVIDYSGSTVPVYVDPSDDFGDGERCSGTASGSCENDQIVSTATYGSEVIKGGSNDDTLYATRGGMRLTGGPGNDKLYATKVPLAISAQIVSFDGGPGADLLQGGTVPSTLTRADYTARTQGVYIDFTDSAGEGENCPGTGCEGDQLINISTIDGTPYDDTVIRGNINNGTVNGLGGNDELRGGVAQEFLSGGPGNDTLTGGPKADALFGDGGDDQLFAKDGEVDAAVWCSAGDDSFLADANDPLADCEHDLGAEPPPTTARATVSMSGTGAVSYSVTAADDNDLSVTRSGDALVIAESNLAAMIADGDGDGGCTTNGSTVTCPAATTLTASLGDGADRLRVEAAGIPTVVDGGDGDDTITTGDAADQLFGAAGDDRLDGGLGSDIFSGGLGDDTVDYGNRSTDVTADLDNGTLDDGASTERDTIQFDIENLIGGSGSDRLKGNAGPNRLSGGAGRDKLDGLAGDDVLSGGAGDKDAIKGGAGNDELAGGPGLDDSLNAGAGDDRLLAKDGQRDKMSCGAGVDEYAFDHGLDKPSSKTCEMEF